VISLKNDPSDIVREQAVHNLCDGSPKEMEEKVIETLETMWNDQSEVVRKKVRKVLVGYRKTGRWNVL
jgi:hypothetical protein